MEKMELKDNFRVIFISKFLNVQIFFLRYSFALFILWKPYLISSKLCLNLITSFRTSPVFLSPFTTSKDLQGRPLFSSSPYYCQDSQVPYCHTYTIRRFTFIFLQVCFLYFKSYKRSIIAYRRIFHQNGHSFLAHTSLLSAQ